MALRSGLSGPLSRPSAGLMSLLGQARRLTPRSRPRGLGRLRGGPVVTQRADDLQVGKPAPWAFHLEDRLPGAHFVDDVRESSVAAGAADLGLRERAHLTAPRPGPGWRAARVRVGAQYASTESRCHSKT